MNIEDKCLIIVKSNDGLERNVLVDKNVAMTITELIDYAKEETRGYFTPDDPIVSAELRFVMPTPKVYVEPRKMAKRFYSPETSKPDVISSYDDDSEDKFATIIFEWAGQIDETDPNSHREFCELIQLALNNREHEKIAKMLAESEFAKVINELGLHEEKLWYNYESQFFISEDEKRLLKTIVDWRDSYRAALDEDE